MSTATRMLLLGSLTLAAATSASSAQVYDGSPAAKIVDRLVGGPRWSPVASFDVAGVRLDMTPEEARAALRRSGFVPAAEEPVQDAFGTIVSQRAVERGAGATDRSKVPMFTRARGVQGETIDVWYAAARQGARVTQVKYLMPTSRMESTAFSKGMGTKYGRPTFRQGARSFYCTEPERVCAGHATKMLPFLSAATEDSYHELDLQIGQRYHDALKAETAAAVETAAPRNAKASF